MSSLLNAIGIKEKSMTSGLLRCSIVLDLGAFYSVGQFSSESALYRMLFFVTLSHSIWPSALLNPEMSVDWSVASRSREVFIFPVGDVLPRAVVSILFRKAEVYDEHLSNFNAKVG